MLFFLLPQARPRPNYSSIMHVRVRFAPSPTGFLHIGGARTALFNWLYARHTGGTFILRIEDTDAARNTESAVNIIIEGLRWLGLEWDEGPQTSNADGRSMGQAGPYFQSRRSAIYQARVEELKMKGLAYEHEGAVKFRMPREPITINDLVVGEVRRELTDRESKDPDFVIVRSDGQPVFHLVNVVDDLEMDITHVIRGEDHLSNTAKHIALFNAFGTPPPRYAHIPLILNTDGSKMSKRDQGASLISYMQEGFVPEAVANYLCLLGWSPKDNREILAQSEIISRFDLPQILRHNARFDFTKLRWLNWEYIRSMERDRYLKLAVSAMEQAGFDLSKVPPDYTAAALLTCKEKVQQLSELASLAGFYFRDDMTFEESVRAKEFNPESGACLLRLKSSLEALDLFSADHIQQVLKRLAAESYVKMSVFVHPLRVACTGSTTGPSLYHLVEILGKSRVIHRLDQALALCG